MIGRVTTEGKKIAYVLDAADLSIKDVLEFEEYEFLSDTEFAGKSYIVVYRQPEIGKDDFVLCRCAGEETFTGICQNFESESGSGRYKLNLLQPECLFDRFIFPENEELISSEGIEDFIASAITGNWIQSGDDFLDRDYLSVAAETHTPVYAAVSTTVSLTDGAYNLKTYIGNAMEYYGIRMSFDFSEAGELAVSIYRDDAEEIAVDTTVSDVAGYEEIYSVDAMAKLEARWEREENGMITTVDRTYYLLQDRTITTDGTDPRRAKGSVKAAVIKTQTEEEFLQEVRNRFASNTYSHKISFRLRMDSKLLDYTQLYAGRPAAIKTKSGIRRTIVTAAGVSDGSSFVSVTFGKLKVTLIEKIRSIT